MRMRYRDNQALNHLLEVMPINVIRVHHHAVNIKCADREQPVPNNLFIVANGPVPRI